MMDEASSQEPCPTKMTGTAELIALARLESIDEDGNITDQVKYDLARALAAQAQEIADETPGTPLGRLNAIGRFAEQRGLCAGIEAKAAELFLMEAFDAQAQEIEKLFKQVGLRHAAYLNMVKRAEAAEARIKEIEGIGKRTQDDWPLCFRLALERGGLPAWLREFALMWDGHGHEIHCVRIKEAADAIEAAEARVRELEDTTMSVECLDAVRRDVEAAIIERCAAIVGDHRVAARIRALAKAPS
jgi:hypothetical protein